MPRLDDSRPALLDALVARYGDLHPRSLPADLDPFERVATILLGLIAEPRVVEAALKALRGQELLEPEALAGADASEVEDLFQTHRVRISARSFAIVFRLARWAADSGFDAEYATAVSTETLREEWRALKGVGPATVDSLLLHALDRAAYPVDRGSYRIFARHGWIDDNADYDEARSVLEGVAPDDPRELARLSAGLQRLAREFCKPGTPRCEQCPLHPLLPESGPLGGE